MHTVKIRSVMVAGTVRGFFLGFVRKKARVMRAKATSNQGLNLDDMIQNNCWLCVVVRTARTVVGNANAGHAAVNANRQIKMALREQRQCCYLASIAGCSGGVNSPSL